jgi:hypothetical protein
VIAAQRAAFPPPTTKTSYGLLEVIAINPVVRILRHTSQFDSTFVAANRFAGRQEYCVPHGSARCGSKLPRGNGGSANVGVIQTGRLAIRDANVLHGGADGAMPEALFDEREIHVAGDQVRRKPRGVRKKHAHIEHWPGHTPGALSLSSEIHAKLGSTPNLLVYRHSRLPEAKAGLVETL